MGPSFVDNVITILKVVGIGYLILAGLSLLGLVLLCLYERLFPMKGELVSTTPVQSMTNPAPTFVVVDRLARQSAQNPLLNRMLMQCHEVTVGSAEISAKPYFHAN